MMTTAETDITGWMFERTCARLCTGALQIAAAEGSPHTSGHAVVALERMLVTAVALYSGVVWWGMA